MSIAVGQGDLLAVKQLLAKGADPCAGEDSVSMHTVRTHPGCNGAEALVHIKSNTERVIVFTGRAADKLCML